jgi:membrane protein implicated in regulation of membrane protease activity
MNVGKIQTLPWYLRLTVFVVIAGVMYAGFWYFVTRGTRAQTKALNEEIAQLL